MNYSKLTNVPTYYASKSSTMTIDSNLDIANYKFMKNGNELIGLSTNSVQTNHINDNAITDSKIQSMSYNKLTNVPTSYASKASIFTIDSNINMNTYKLTVPTPTDNTHAANKVYVDSILGNNTGSPIGCIMIWATTTIPTNWLECNGQNVDQSKYSQLYAMMTTVPDLRGVFVRGYDNNKGYDSGRTINSYQADNFASHTHTMTSGGNHNHFNGIICGSGYGTWGYGGPWPGTIQFSGASNLTNTQGFTSGAGDHTHTINATGGTETRPKNVALIYIIKAI